MTIAVVCLSVCLIDRLCLSNGVGDDGQEWKRI